MPKLWRILLVILCCLLLAVLLWRSPPKELSEILSDKPTTPNYPTSYLMGVKTQQYDEQGQLSYTLIAETIKQFDAKNTAQPPIVIQQPELTLYDRDAPSTPWMLSADYAEADEKQDELILKTNVIIEQDDKDGRYTKLSTSELLIKPTGRYAETDKPVIMTSETGTITATGLKVFFDEERIELLSNVKGLHIPQQ